MSKKTNFKILSAMLLVASSIISMPFQAQAAVFQRFGNDYVINADYSNCYDAETAKSRAEEALDTEFKACNLETFSRVETNFMNGNMCITLRESEVNQLVAIENSSRQWLAQNMPSIVPSGTDPLSIPQICADYLANRLSYDYGAWNNGRLDEYQTALTGFYEGVGVCATYAHCFESMVSFVPINTSTNMVDWSCMDPAYLQTAFVHNAGHGWSAVKVDGIWHQYDVTMYDQGSFTAPQYLDMTADVLNDQNHAGVCVRLF